MNEGDEESGVATHAYIAVSNRWLFHLCVFMILYDMYMSIYTCMLFVIFLERFYSILCSVNIGKTQLLSKQSVCYLFIFFRVEL